MMDSVLGEGSESNSRDLLVLDDYESFRFLEWLKSRSPSSHEVKLVCERLAWIHALALVLMYYATSHVDGPELVSGLALASLIVLLSLVNRQG
jgi:hypothetical protein